MRARTKIQLITTVFAIATALGFSTAILWSLIEQPIRLIDRELYEVEEQLSDLLSVTPSRSSAGQIILPSQQFREYAISIEAPDNILLWKTSLADRVNFQFRQNDSHYFQTFTVKMEDLYLNEADRKEIDHFSEQKVVFRVYNTSISTKERDLKIFISRPIPVLVDEIKELLMTGFLSLAICSILVFVAGYFLANRILGPLVSINEQIEEITSTSLHKRIPISGNQDELHALSASLNQMFDRLEFSFTRQKAFISNASHDLKSPLTSLRLGLEKLVSENLSEHHHSIVMKQLNTTRRVSRLVYNLLEISRLEQQESFNVVDVDLKTTIATLLNEFEELFVAQDITVTLDLDEIKIRADPEKISRIIINLLDNAIKYNLPSDGKIDIQLKKNKQLAEIIFANTGPLIPEDSLQYLFDQFYRVEKSRSLEYGGSGLGLTIVKHIVELHRGQITVHNSSSGSIVFTVILPA